MSADKQESDTHKQAHEVAALFRGFTKSSHAFYDGRPLHLVAADLLESLSAAPPAPTEGERDPQSALTPTDDPQVADGTATITFKLRFITKAQAEAAFALLMGVVDFIETGRRNDSMR